MNVSHSNGKSYNVAFDNVAKLKKFICLNNEYEQRKLQKGVRPTLAENDNSSKVEISEMNVPKLLREYKKLLEEGIISEEEFEKKKFELL